MADILFIKTSSLGDVIHHMPALTEARKAQPEATFAWLVEEAFAPLVRLHPAVAEVIPVAWRRWRKSLLCAGNAGRDRRQPARHPGARYDEIVDSQGLLRSAMIARLAHGRRHGYDAAQHPRAACRAASTTSATASAATCMRSSATASSAAWRLAMQPQGAPDFGLDRARLAAPGERYAVLLHATARPEKQWPEAHWIALGQALGRAGHRSRAAVGHGRPSAAAASASRPQLPRARVPERAPLDAVARLIAGAQFVVGVDTGLMHLAAALGVPLVAIFAGSKPGLTGPVGYGPLAVLGAQGAAAVSRGGRRCGRDASRADRALRCAGAQQIVDVNDADRLAGLDREQRSHFR